MTQPELFEDIHTATAPAKRRAGAPVFATRRFSWSATYQQLALAGALLILAFVLAFALGVEQGQHATQAAAAKSVVAGGPSPPARMMRLAGNPAVVSPPTVAARTTGPPTTRPPVVAPSPGTPTRPASASPATSGRTQYTVQLGTYATRAEAERQLVKLKQGGYSAYISEGNRRVSLCVGIYPTREAATKQLGIFRKKFHDCFVRVR